MKSISRPNKTLTSLVSVIEGRGETSHFLSLRGVRGRQTAEGARTGAFATVLASVLGPDHSTVAMSLVHFKSVAQLDSLSILATSTEMGVLLDPSLPVLKSMTAESLSPAAEYLAAF